MKFAIFTDPHLSAYPTKLYEFSLFIKNTSSQVDAFICSGDWCSRDVKELEEIFKTFRENTDKPLLTVFGNHDYWSVRAGKTLDEVVAIHQEMCDKYNITNLNNTYFENDTLFIGGFDGWYHRHTNSTVDYSFIPFANSYGATPFQFLKKKEIDSFYKLLDKMIEIKDEPKTKICVTHFGFHHDEAFRDWGANPQHFEEIKENFDILIVGHSHRAMDTQIERTRVINAGARYESSPGAFCMIMEF